MKFNFFILSILLFTIPAFGQDILEICGTIKNAGGYSIPFASVYTNSQYGIIADQNGVFSLKVSSKDSIKFTAVGFTRKSILAADLRFNANVVLDSLIKELPELKVRGNSENLTIGKKGRILKNEYTMSTNFWHGTLIQDVSLKNRKLKSIKFKIGFKGEPILPFRLGVFSVDKRGFPKENILQKEVLIYPSHKFEWHEINLENQDILIQDSKIVIALELLNISNNLMELNKEYSPLIGIGKLGNQSPVFITNKLNKWVKLGQKHPIFILELE